VGGRRYLLTGINGLHDGRAATPGSTAEKTVTGLIVDTQTYKAGANLITVV
jgi:hypothetical protein